MHQCIIENIFYWTKKWYLQNINTAKIWTHNRIILFSKKVELSWSYLFWEQWIMLLCVLLEEKRGMIGIWVAWKGVGCALYYLVWTYNKRLDHTQKKKKRSQFILWPVLHHFFNILEGVFTKKINYSKHKFKSMKLFIAKMGTNDDICT